MLGSEKGAERERNAFRFHLEEKCWCGGKRMQTKSWRKEWNNDHSLDVVHRQIFVVTQQRYRSNSQFRLLFLKCFPIAGLTLTFYRARVLWLMVVFNTLNWADVERNYWNEPDPGWSGLRVLHVSFFEVMMVVNPQTSSLVPLVI